MRRRVFLMRAECEVFEYNPRIYFLMSGYDRPIGVPYVVEELVDEFEMISVNEIVAHHYKSNLSHAVIDKIGRTASVSEKFSFAKRIELATEFARVLDNSLSNRRELITETFATRFGFTRTREREMPETIRGLNDFMRKIGNVMVVIDLAHFYEVSELQKLLELFRDFDNIYMIFHNVSQYSNLYYMLKEREI